MGNPKLCQSHKVVSERLLLPNPRKAGGEAVGRCGRHDEDLSAAGIQAQQLGGFGLRAWRAYGIPSLNPIKGLSQPKLSTIGICPQVFGTEMVAASKARILCRLQGLAVEGLEFEAEGFRTQPSGAELSE